jgi:UDP-glucose:(heptosyl)LPS alpha-1,3-glucosyltransferase
VERVAWDLMAYLAPRRSVVFVGRSAPDGLPDGVRFLETASTRSTPRAVQPLAFRRAAQRHFESLAPRATVSLGVAAPPNDVLWVQSVHSAWLQVAPSVPFGRFSAPAKLRYAMPRHLILLALERQYFRSDRARAIICTSRREVDDLAETYGVDPAKTRVLPNPFDPDVFNVRRRAGCRAEVRARLGLRDGELALFFVANELHRKGFAQTLSALADVRDDRLSLHVIGRMPPTAYFSMIGRLQLTGRVRYHGATRDVGWWLAGADVLVLPTQYEPFGLVIVEALASGVPVITTRVAGASEAVQHGVTGLLQDDPYDVSELASLIRAALAADLETWGQRAAASVNAYRRDHVMARVEEILLPD